MNLLKSLAAVSSMTMFSRVLGFARDAIVARIFGAGMATDAFFVAFKLPNLLRRIFAEGAFSQRLCQFWRNIKASRGRCLARLCFLYLWLVDVSAGSRHCRRDARCAVGYPRNVSGWYHTDRANLR